MNSPVHTASLQLTPDIQADCYTCANWNGSLLHLPVSSTAALNHLLAALQYPACILLFCKSGREVKAVHLCINKLLEPSIEPTSFDEVFMLNPNQSLSFPAWNILFHRLSSCFLPEQTTPSSAKLPEEVECILDELTDICTYILQTLDFQNQP